MKKAVKKAVKAAPKKEVQRVFIAPELPDPSEPIPESVKRYIREVPRNAVAIIHGAPPPDPGSWN